MPEKSCRPVKVRFELEQVVAKAFYAFFVTTSLTINIIIIEESRTEENQSLQDSFQDDCQTRFNRLRVTAAIYCFCDSAVRSYFLVFAFSWLISFVPTNIST